MNGHDIEASRDESPADDAAPTTDDGSLSMRRRGAMAMLGAVGLGALATGSAGAQGSGRGNGG